MIVPQQLIANGRKVPEQQEWLWVPPGCSRVWSSDHPETGSAPHGMRAP